MNKVEIFTDGACKGNPGPGGWGAILRYKNKEKEIKGFSKETTNNIMELKAVIEALKNLKKPCEIIITTDSKYVKNGIDGYIKTFNWSIDDLKKKRNIYDDFEKKINDNNQNIFKELEEIKQITNSLISFPEKLNEYRSSLIETRLSFEEFNSHIKAHDRLKDDITIIREKKTFYKKSNINRNQEMKDLSNDLKKVLDFDKIVLNQSDYLKNVSELIISTPI